MGMGKAPAQLSIVPPFNTHREANTIELYDVGFRWEQERLNTPNRQTRHNWCSDEWDLLEIASLKYFWKKWRLGLLAETQLLW